MMTSLMAISYDITISIVDTISDDDFDGVADQSVSSTTLDDDAPRIHY